MSIVLRAEDITQMLHAVKQGDRGSADKLMQAVYHDLKRVARRHMASERPGHTLQPTAVINEVFLRMFKPTDADPSDWRPVSSDLETRRRFHGIAARQMRQVLIEHARQKRAVKRNFGVKIEFPEDLPGLMDQHFGVVDQLLTLLAAKDAQAARVVELKVFGGMTNEEAAAEMGISASQLRRDWTFASSWLKQRIPGAKES